MAMLFTVRYPRGELATATGYPGTLLVVLTVPRGPEACLFDQLEVDFAEAPGVAARVLRVAAGPRRPSLRVRLDGATEADVSAWLDAREAEGWWTSIAPGDPGEVWVVRPAPRVEGERAGWTAVCDAPAGDRIEVFDRAGLDEDRRALAALGARLIDA